MTCPGSIILYTSVTLSFAAILYLELFLQSFDSFFLSRFILTSHFISYVMYVPIQCPTFDDEKFTLLSTLTKTDFKLLELTNFCLSPTLLAIWQHNI